MQRSSIGDFVNALARDFEARQDAEAASHMVVAPPPPSITDLESEVRRCRLARDEARLDRQLYPDHIAYRRRYREASDALQAAEAGLLAARIADAEADQDAHDHAVAVDEACDKLRIHGAAD